MKETVPEPANKFMRKISDFEQMPLLFKTAAVSATLAAATFVLTARNEFTEDGLSIEMMKEVFGFVGFAYVALQSFILGKKETESSTICVQQPYHNLWYEVDDGEKKYYTPDDIIMPRQFTTRG